MTKFSQKLIVQVRQMRQLRNVAMEYEHRGTSNVTIAIFSGGVKKNIIRATDWDAVNYPDGIKITSVRKPLRRRHLYTQPFATGWIK
jgi:hypothetical protein